MSVLRFHGEDVPLPVLRLVEHGRGAARIVYHCPVCEWEDDYAQGVDADLEGGANSLSLAAARRAFATHPKPSPSALTTPSMRPLETSRLPAAAEPRTSAREHPHPSAVARRP
ncbi:MAG: CPCC family cysteine-rich protein [Vicinamibacterales bacterium]